MAYSHRSSSSKNKLERIDFRITSKIKQALNYAAELSGVSLSTFLIEAAQEKAAHVIHEQELLVLTNKERNRFLALLESPPKPAAKLKIAMRRYLAKGDK